MMITTTTTPPTPPAIDPPPSPSTSPPSHPSPTHKPTTPSSPFSPTDIKPLLHAPHHNRHRQASTTTSTPSTTSTTTTTTTTSASPSLMLSATPLAARKYSFPLAASLHTTLLNADVGGLLSARRRLSNVSDAVTRKLSNTIGWKTPAVPAPEIITQGRCLCGQYVRGRLRRAGVYNKKMGLHRMRSFVGGTALAVVRDVYPALSCMGEELERLHPKLFSSVARQVSSRGSGGDLKSTENASFLLSTIARDLFRADITWSKVTALFAIAGGLALDCVRQGHPEFVPKLIESMADVIEDELVVWIGENGGWIGLNVHVRPETSEFSLAESTCLAAACLVGVLLLFHVLKFIGFQLIPWMVWMS